MVDTFVPTIIFCDVQKNHQSCVAQNWWYWNVRVFAYLKYSTADWNSFMSYSPGTFL